MDDKNKRYFDYVEKHLNPLGIRKATLSLTPFVYSPDLQQEVKEISISYAKILEYLFQQYPEDERIREVLGYSGELESHLREMTVYPRNMALARLDIFRTVDGLRMVESNTETPGGNEECTALETGYLDVMGLEGVRQLDRLEVVFNTLIDHYKVQMEYKGIPVKEKPTVNLITWDWDIERIRGEYDVLINTIRDKGCKCDIIDPNKLVFEGRDAINPEMGEKVDLFYRRFTSDELPKHAEYGFGLAKKLNDSGAAVVNPFCTKRVDSKNIMVLVKDESYGPVFSSELHPHVERIRGILPWTRKIGEEIEVDGEPRNGYEFLLEERERLVIKEANSYSSVGVFIGEDKDEEEWNQIVDMALGGDFIVQEKINLPTMPVRLFDGENEFTKELIYNVNPYMFNGDFGGIYVRASTDKLTSFKVGHLSTVLPAFMEGD